ncbi:MAG: SDR family NAD(P)-dependent oxidoreductase [Acidimicrobiales bacterium]
MQALVDAAVGHFGRIDVMINNAGLGGSAEDHRDDRRQWATVLDDPHRHLPLHPRAVLRHAGGAGGAA